MGRRRSIKNTESETRMKTWDVGIYVRLSNENNGLEDDRSLRNQLEYCKDYVKEHPEFRLVDTYMDNGTTGTNFDRPEFLRLMEDVKDGKIGCIIVKDLSRFGRNYLETGYYMEKIFPFLNLRFIAINDNYDNTDERKRNSLAVPIKNLVNEMYSKDISKKVRAGMRAGEKKGTIRFGAAPYGYIADPDKPFQLMTDEKTAAFVRLMFQWAAEGASYGSIASRLSKMGAITPLQRMRELGCLNSQKRTTTDQWRPTSIKTMLKNPLYTGDMVYNRSIYSNGKSEKQDREYWNVIPGTHEALVSHEEFEKVLRCLEKIKVDQIKMWESTNHRLASRPNVFQNVFYCSDCGRKMYYYRYFRENELRVCNYYCKGVIRGEPACPGERLEIPDRLFRMMVFDQIKLQVQAAGQIEAVVKELKQLHAVDGELEKQQGSIQMKLRNLSAKRQHLYEDYAEGTLDEEDYQELKAVYDESFRSLSEELERVEREIESFYHYEVPDEAWKEVSEKVLCADQLTQELVDAMIQRLEFGSDHVLRITYRFQDWVVHLQELTERLNKGKDEDS